MDLDKEKGFMELLNKKNIEIRSLKKQLNDSQIGKLTKALNEQTKELNKIKSKFSGLLIKYNTIVDAKNKRAYKPPLGKKVESRQHKIHKKPNGKHYQIVDNVPVLN